MAKDSLADHVRSIERNVTKVGKLTKEKKIGKGKREETAANSETNPSRSTSIVAHRAAETRRVKSRLSNIAQNILPGILDESLTVFARNSNSTN